MTSSSGHIREQRERADAGALFHSVFGRETSGKAPARGNIFLRMGRTEAAGRCRYPSPSAFNIQRVAADYRTHGLIDADDKTQMPGVLVIRQDAFSGLAACPRQLAQVALGLNLWSGADWRGSVFQLDRRQSGIVDIRQGCTLRSPG